ncbi:MAG: rRNA maturation RNase YbeY [Lachnospiraceae bacterium]|nr:rRNA maturation RNase YbeY [Lachnospiraceae bacterium]MBQ5431809.1 rRNA maturation RNase YbeY [Lachnospiraceae bacterium]MBQ5484537.1 rRNA maturation RNase YbeY [Lachnospiraceae bacterium]MEE3354727.1 rRNA maturation RNase YbeY [Candidatus Weimeria sp.]
MTLILEEELTQGLDFDYKKVAEDVIEAALMNENFPYEAEVSLTLTGMEEIHEINRQFRQIDRPTDVLSFPMIEYPAAGDFTQLNDDSGIFDPESGEAVLGDIVLNIPQVLLQAREYGHSILREYAFLIAHSMLHLMGYDHMEQEERTQMEEHQRQIMERLAITRE